MSDYEYEKVEGLKGWEIVKLHEEGIELYTGKYDYLRVDEIKNVGALVAAMEAGSLYARKEKPWWDNYKGIVMVRDNGKRWEPRIFAYYDKQNKATPFVIKSGIQYEEMRPLTSAERDAIKVRG